MLANEFRLRHMLHSLVANGFTSLRPRLFKSSNRDLHANIYSLSTTTKCNRQNGHPIPSTRRRRALPDSPSQSHQQHRQQRQPRHRRHPQPAGDEPSQPSSPDYANSSTNRPNSAQTAGTLLPRPTRRGSALQAQAVDKNEEGNGGFRCQDASRGAHATLLFRGGEDYG